MPVSITGAPPGQSLAPSLAIVSSGLAEHLRTASVLVLLGGIHSLVKSLRPFSSYIPHGDASVLTNGYNFLSACLAPRTVGSVAPDR